MSKKILRDGKLSEVVLPFANDVLGVASKLLSFDRVMVKCQDGRERLCQIRGRMKRRVWMREGNVGLVSPWDSEKDKRVDLIWRHTRAQAENLHRRGHVTISQTQL